VRLVGHAVQPHRSRQQIWAGERNLDRAICDCTSKCEFVLYEWTGSSEFAEHRRMSEFFRRNVE
ncbi:MAG TPA: hypothetical protein VN641_04955, partial [Urbifossiella sp.]|nr:hypothetical protein [Urbifossiella sp.]